MTKWICRFVCMGCLWAGGFNTAFSFAQSFWESHTLLLVYSSTCPYCHQQGEVLKPLVERHRLPLALFGVDNQPLAGFSHFAPVPDGLMQAAFPDGQVSFPALFVIENQKLKVYPLSKGLLGREELMARLDALTPKIIAFERGQYA